MLDAAGMSDLDYTGSRVLGQILDQLEKGQLRFVVARAGEHVRTSLARSGLLDRIGADHLYPSVNAAVIGEAG